MPPLSGLLWHADNHGWAVITNASMPTWAGLKLLKDLASLVISEGSRATRRFR